MLNLKSMETETLAALSPVSTNIMLIDTNVFLETIGKLNFEAQIIMLIHNNFLENAFQSGLFELAKQCLLAVKAENRSSLLMATQNNETDNLTNNALCSAILNNNMPMLETLKKALPNSELQKLLLKSKITNQPCYVYAENNCSREFNDLLKKSLPMNATQPPIMAQAQKLKQTFHHLKFNPFNDQESLESSKTPSPKMI